MAIYKFEDLLKKHNVTADKVTTYGSPESIQNSLNEMQAKKPSRLKETFGDIKQIGTDIISGSQKRTDKISEISQAQASGEQGTLRSNLQKVGQLAGAGADAIGSVFKGAGNILLSDKHEKDVTDVINKFGAKVMAIPKVQSIINNYNELPEDKQRDLDAIGGVVNLVSNFVGGQAVSKGATVAKQGITTGAKVAGEVVETGVSGLKQATGNVLEKTGQKIQNTVIKPSIRDVKDGFKIENVSKYDVGGSLPETIAKTHTKMNQLSQELNTKLKGTTEKLNLNKVYGDTIKSLGGDKALSFGDNAAIQRVVKSLGSEIKQVSDDGLVDLVKATNVKRGAGSKGAWAYNRPEADSSAIEKVYTAFYKNLKDEIEKVAPEGVKDINKQISELIPINNAALRRMTVEERNNALSLMDNIGLVSSVFDPRALALFGTNRLLKSGKVGAYLTKTGAKLKGTTGTSPKVSPKQILPLSVKSTSPNPTTPSLKVKGTIPENSGVSLQRNKVDITKLKAEAVKRGFDLSKISKEVENKISKAEPAKQYIDSAIDKITTGNKDLISVKAPIKAINRTLEKTVLEADGIVENIKDIARNTIIPLTSEARATAIKSMDLRTDIFRKKIQTPDKFMGYEGVVYNIKTPTGFIAETQIVSPKMTFGKNLPETARKLLGDDLFNSIKKETGLEPGRGHKIYEAYRKLSPMAQLGKKGSALKKMSIDYYSKLR